MKTAYETAAGMMISHIVGASEKVSTLCALLATPEGFSSVLASDATISSFLCLNARTQVGTGLGGHPSAGGHAALFDAVKTSYETGYTANQ